MRDFAAHAPDFRHLQMKSRGDLERFPKSILDEEEPKSRAPLLATHWVNCVGDQIGIVVAESLPLARQAAETVVVEYEEEKPIFTIEEAIEANELFKYGHGIKNGNVDEAMEAAAHTVEGELTMNGQEHWYTEPHALTVIPGEDEEMTVISCTQCVMKTQHAVAKALGVPACKVTCKVKRIGGAFGGKEVLSGEDDRLPSDLSLGRVAHTPMMLCSSAHGRRCGSGGARPQPACAHAAHPAAGHEHLRAAPPVPVQVQGGLLRRRDHHGARCEALQQWWL